MKKFKVEKLSRQAQKEILGGKILRDCPKYTCVDSSVFTYAQGACYMTSNTGADCYGELRNGLCCFY